jgi:hypothetical protein
VLRGRDGGPGHQDMHVTHGTISTIITVLAALILVAAIPAAVRETFETGSVYFF